VADEQARLTLRAALDGFDSAHLQKVLVTAFDRWNWDSSSEMDKDWFEIAEELLKERGISVMNTSTNNSVVFSTGQGSNLPVISVGADQNLVLGTTKTLSIKDASDPFNIKHDLFGVSNNTELEIGWDLKRALVNFIANELNGGTVSANNGQNLKQIFEDKTMEALRNRI